MPHGKALTRGAHTEARAHCSAHGYTTSTLLTDPHYTWVLAGLLHLVHVEARRNVQALCVLYEWLHRRGQLNCPSCADDPTQRARTCGRHGVGLWHNLR